MCVIRDLMIKCLQVFLVCQCQEVREVLVGLVPPQAPLDQQNLCFPLKSVKAVKTFICYSVKRQTQNQSLNVKIDCEGSVRFTFCPLGPTTQIDPARP